MRLLTLATLGFNHIGQNLAYTSIAEALQIDVSQVEKWVIDSVFLSPFPLFSLILNCESLSHSYWTLTRQTLSNIAEPLRRSLLRPIVRKRAMGNSREAYDGLESQSSESYRRHKRRKENGRTNSRCFICVDITSSCSLASVDYK